MLPIVLQLPISQPRTLYRVGSIAAAALEYQARGTNAKQPGRGRFGGRSAGEKLEITYSSGC
jgi:hypothetical protein